MTIIHNKRHSSEYHMLLSFKEKIKWLERKKMYLKQIKTSYWNLNIMSGNNDNYDDEIKQITRQIKSINFNIKIITSTIIDIKQTIKTIQRNYGRE